ncbi:MAG: ABC transporter permease, partial [Burkholderiales bacterium]
MYRYILKRLLLVIPTLLGAALLVFVLLRLIPGDTCELRLAGSGGYFDQAALDDCRHEMGIDRPMVVQFGSFVWGLARFDFGTSMWTGQPIVSEISRRFQLSMEIAILATIVAILVSVPLGTISAVKQNTWIDYVVRAISIAGTAMPSFWLGILIILGLLIGSQHFFGAPWMPPITYTPIWVDPVHNLSMVIWPAIATGYRYSAVATRMTRSALLEVLREDYVRTARAKGLWEKLIIRRHALKNAMLPVITVIGIEFAFLIGGLVVTEQVFNLNGLGKLFVESVTNNDYTMTQALV